MPLVCLAPETGLASPPLVNFSPNPVRTAVALSVDRHRALPAVEPGQLWLIEISPGHDLSTSERHALGSANVILYDRGLADEVAAILPLGGYAEPAPAPAELPDAAVIERCVRFALDGWSVVRLIDAGHSRPSRTARLRAISSRLRAGGANSGLPVRIFADAGRRTYAEGETSLGALDPASEGARDGRLIVIFGAVAAGTAPPPYAAAANGLAG